LCIGAFIAFYFAKKDRAMPNVWLSQSASLLGLLLIAYAVFAFDKNTPFPSLYALVPTVGAALIIVSRRNRRWRVNC
jgi:peptidoglycan/LPS O-acetylase OafA/YrhL